MCNDYDSVKFSTKVITHTPHNSNHFVHQYKSTEEGIVEEVTYIATTIRREDNSVVVVPNQVFSKGEIINWSRTPFRLFKTSVQVKMSDCNILGESDSTQMTLMTIVMILNCAFSLSYELIFVTFLFECKIY